MRAKLNHTTRGLAALAVSFLAGACAEPVGDINTVQPGYLSKSLFEKEWYYRQTIVESDPGTGLSGAFVGLEADIEKIRWEIREDKLIAYRTHEGVPGIDEDRTQPGSDYKGDPIAMFDVKSHFDIQRRYNTSTGEQSNVIAENKSDRPWNEREYFRISVDNRRRRRGGLRRVPQLRQRRGRWFDALRPRHGVPVLAPPARHRAGLHRDDHAPHRR
jgi:hypothetical protein